MAVVINKTNVSKSVGTKQKQKQMALVTTNPSVQEKQKQSVTNKTNVSKSVGAKQLVSKSKVKNELAVIKENMRKTWFNPDSFDTSRIKHPKKVKKELPEDAKIFCVKCNEVFETSNDLVAHEKNCFKGRRYACAFKGGCNCTFPQKSLMHQQLKVVHYDNPFKCEFCTQTFMYKKSLDSHLNQQHQQKEKDEFKYRCSECDKATDDLTEFKVHMNKHCDIKTYKWNICNQKCFYLQSQLTDHLKRCRSLPEMKYECSVCSKKFSQEDCYREHFKAQHVDTVKAEIYYCEMCIICMFNTKAFNKHCEVGECNNG